MRDSFVRSQPGSLHYNYKIASQVQANRLTSVMILGTILRLSANTIQM